MIESVKKTPAASKHLKLGRSTETSERLGRIFPALDAHLRSTGPRKPPPFWHHNGDLKPDVIFMIKASLFGDALRAISEV